MMHHSEADRTVAVYLAASLPLWLLATWPASQVFSSV